MKDATIGKKFSFKSIGKTVKKAAAKAIKPAPNKPSGPSTPKDSWNPTTRGNDSGGKSLKDIRKHFEKLGTTVKGGASETPSSGGGKINDKSKWPNGGKSEWPDAGKAKWPGANLPPKTGEFKPPIGINGSRPSLPFEPYLPQNSGAATPRPLPFEPFLPQNSGAATPRPLPFEPFLPQNSGGKSSAPRNLDSIQPPNFSLPSRIEAQNGAALPFGILA